MKLQQVFTVLLLVGVPAAAWHFQPSDKIHDAYSDSSHDIVSSTSGPLDTKKIFYELMNIQLEEGVNTYTDAGVNLGVNSYIDYADQFRFLMNEEEKRILSREAEIAAKYSLSRDQVEAIITQGAMNGWLTETESVVIHGQ
ncbi:MAG: hypothetical protein OSB62_01000 [Alphaproteobacteria bacterium]|nr:hypothetical protein [Alphaproteobacteria bacterium]